MLNHSFRDSCQRSKVTRGETNSKCIRAVIIFKSLEAKRAHRIYPCGSLCRDKGSEQRDQD
jgi:hypothetical protein